MDKSFDSGLSHVHSARKQENSTRRKYVLPVDDLLNNAKMRLAASGYLAFAWTLGAIRVQIQSANSFGFFVWM